MLIFDDGIGEGDNKGEDADENELCDEFDDGIDENNDTLDSVSEIPAAFVGFILLNNLLESSPSFLLQPSSA